MSPGFCGSHWKSYCSAAGQAGNFTRKYPPDTFSYRTHALHLRAAVEVEANCKAILAENGFVKRDKAGKALDQSDWNMGDYRKVEKTHQLSAYEVRLPVWKGAPVTRKPFEQWATGNALPWWGAYNDAKHDRHERFSRANFTNLIDAICAVVAILSAQFYTHDFAPGATLMAWDGGQPVGYDTAIAVLDRQSLGGSNA